jgi:phospholipase/lecithinase/hemolysin
MKTIASRRLFVTVLATLACMAGPVLAAGPPQEVTVFGDSLSDPGNVFALTGAVSHTPYAVIPSAPYTTGGLHFSNGKTWIEQRPAGNVNAQSSGPAYQVRGVFTNYAVGGARARPDAGGLVQGNLTVQVQNYLADFAGARPEATHVIFIGGNDIRDALLAGGGAPSVAILNAAVTAVAGNIQTLYFAGARRFVVVNGPDVGLVPAVRLLGPAAQAGATALSAGYNAGLAAAVAGLNAALPGIQIALVDLFGFLDDVVANPGQYGLTDVTDMCITPGVMGNAKCSNPNDYLFWDGIHPTTAGHALLAELIGAAL